MALRNRPATSKRITYKLCSLLLQYPDQQLLDAREELATSVLGLPRAPAAPALARFCDWWRNTDPMSLQQHYVEIFDLDKRCGLYLTFYGQGDKRERGMALLRLKRLYRAAGLPLQAGELPDFLPAMLEFASAAPRGYGDIVLREHRAALEFVRLSLRARGTPYAHLIDAVCATVGDPSPAERAHAIRLAASGPPQELVGLEPFAPPEVMPGDGARR